jgi:serine/threonine protein kinase
MPSPKFYKTLIAGDQFQLDERYQNLKPIGGGSYGIVVKAEDTITKDFVAIKKINNTFANLTDAKRILREIKLLRHLKHENIISILDIMTVPDDTVDFEDVYLVTNLMETDLDRIIRSKQAMTEQHFQYFVYQMLLGLKYIHSANVLHRDLKPANLLVNANCDLKICDFGLARGVDAAEESPDAPLTEYVVTRWYRAPELLAGNQDYGAGVDMWALGCIFAELLHGTPFFPGKDPKHQLKVIIEKLGSPSESDMDFIDSEAVLKAIREIGFREKVDLKTYFPKATQDALDILGLMLHFDPRQRCTVEEALDHAFMKPLRQEGDDPACKTPFNFDFEKEYEDTGEEIPQAKLQELMHKERMALRPEGEEGRQDPRDTGASEAADEEPEEGGAKKRARTA